MPYIDISNFFPHIYIYIYVLFIFKYTIFTYNIFFVYVLMDTFNTFRMEMFKRNKYARRDVLNVIVVFIKNNSSLLI